MKVDPSKYPQIPPGYSLNEDKKTGRFQVYRDHREKDPKTGKSKNVRTSIGAIRGGVFYPSENYSLRQENAALKAEIEKLKKRQADAPARDEQQVGKVLDRISGAIEKSAIDPRKQSRVQVPMVAIVFASLVCALGGVTDAVLIADWLEQNRDLLERHLPGVKIQGVSHDTVRRCMMLIDPAKFENFYQEMISGLVKVTARRIVAADGQAVRATGRRRRGDGVLHGARMLMNFYDTNNRVCLAQRLIDKKTNEISVGPEMIEKLSLSGAVITADAMSCQVTFVEAVLRAGADYLLSLKGNQELCWREVRALFAETDESQVKRYETDFELAHGRVEKRVVEVLPGRLMSKAMFMKWRGLAAGSIVRVRKLSTYKSTLEESDQYSYYFTSIAPYEESAELIYEAVRAHWSIENNLHYALDVFWDQDAMSAKAPNYIANRSALNKLALAYQENYRYWLLEKGRCRPDDLPSLATLQVRCQRMEAFTECLAAAFGLA